VICEGLRSVAEASHAVFLSYASEDAPAARRIAEALRSAGIEVWFDQSELRGGDAWDRAIRTQIHDCALFVAVISAHSDARHEGYFRREWRLAVERAGDMSERIAFLVPVVIDDTSDSRADVPDRFREVQWTRLPGGDTPPAFVDRIKRLLSPELSRLSAVSSAAPGIGEQVPPSPRWNPFLLRIAAVLILAAPAYFWISKHWTPSATAFAPPPHSIAVLPFVNMSGDKDQEYFSEGLTEELLNSLSRISELQVAARTSSFSFQGEHPDISTVAHKLNVGAVLEGSVRRSANTVRITAQLVNGVTGFHLWSETYDRDLGDVLKLQTDIATAVASALKVTLLGDEASKIELGGTRNPAAFDAYLRGRKTFTSGSTDEEALQRAIAAYTEAIRLDPNYALAFADRSRALSVYAGGAGIPNWTAVHELFDKAQADARQAIKLAPELAEGHLALAFLLVFDSLDFTGASEAYERAMALAPGNSEVLAEGGRFAVIMGRFDAGLAATRRAVVLDPLNPRSHDMLGETLYWTRRYEDAAAALAQAISLESDVQRAYGFRGLAYYGLGDLQSARSSCEAKADHWVSQWCLAVAYEKLGRHADAQAELTRMQAALGDTAPYQYATIYAQWGNAARALESLATAVEVRDPGVAYVKADPLLDPLRKEPRFQAIERELKFPD
jgi:TolB-like protein/cytochrome c-type biogenesis protein CcmH/NrfG